MIPGMFWPFVVCHPRRRSMYGFCPGLQQLSAPPPLEEPAPRLRVGCCQLKFHQEASPRVSYQTDIEHLDGSWFLRRVSCIGKRNLSPQVTSVAPCNVLHERCYRIPLCPQCLCGNCGSSCSDGYINLFMGVIHFRPLPRLRCLSPSASDPSYHSP